MGTHYSYVAVILYGRLVLKSPSRIAGIASGRQRTILTDTPITREAFPDSDERSQNGRLRAQETQPAQLVARWRSLLTKEIIPEYKAWISSSWYRQSFLQRRQLAIQTREIRKGLQQFRNSLGIRTRVRSLLLRER